MLTSTSARSLLRRIGNPSGKMRFIERLPSKARILDVGCGNNSPLATKSCRADLYYVGLDVADCRQSEGSIAKADQYVLTTPEQFAPSIEALDSDFDAVISAHNLEHCFDPDAVLNAMLGRLRLFGQLYLSFPCERSLGFPHRRGSLNFFDDPTHSKPPDYQHVLRIVHDQGYEIEFATARYRPLLKTAIGLAVEPASAVLKKTLPGTWALYGFESIICARRSR